MIICVDARPLVEKKVGFGFFLQNMLEEMLELDAANEYILLSDRDVFFDFSKYKNVKVIQYNNNFFLRKSFYYYYALPRFLKENSILPDVFWGTNHIMPVGFSKDVKKILTIHDFTHIRFPKSTTKFNLLISKLFFAKSINNSDCIICISKNTEKELVEFYPKECNDKTIKTIYEGGYSRRELISRTIEINNVRAEMHKYAQRKYILFVGTIEPRKNIQLLINVAPRLKGIVEVIVCGKIGWESKEVVSQLNSTDNLKYYNYISQDEKKFMMKNAFCQIQPSLYEGFGLPVVESMQSGTVVMVANNSSLKELIEIPELKFETNSGDDLVDKIVTLIRNETMYLKARKYCIERGSEFSWEKAANEYVTLFGRLSNEC